MHQSRGVYFGETQKMLASALHQAGQTDREIADAIPTSVNNIIHWRRDEGLPENRPAGQEEDYSPPVSRPAAPHKSSSANWGYEGNAKVRAASRIQPASPVSTPEEAQLAHAAPVQPTGDNALEIGTYQGKPVAIDLEELLTTRLLVQGNSGSGKSHLLRRVIEESTGIVQQIIIDPEGDFVSLGETFGHTVVNADEHKTAKLAAIALRARQHRGSVVLNLGNLDVEDQMEAASTFIAALFDAPREHWFPALVFVDEAQLFAPAHDGGEDKEIRKGSLLAMTNLMCRGRKRGLAGIIATQRLAKLHKNVAAEASNFLMGRTFLDIDIKRAGDLLGLAPKDVERIRDLKRGEFLGLGPAIARRPLPVAVGSVMTSGTNAAQGLVPLPATSSEAMQSALLVDDDEEDAQPPASVIEPPAPALRIVK